MTREELREHCLKEIKACEFWARKRDEKVSGKIYEEHKLILDLLDQQPKSNWIPVSKRLPKEDGEYLVTEDDVVMTLAYSIEHVWYYNDGEYYQEFDDVTAWMPLPKPYQKEVSE